MAAVGRRPSWISSNPYNFWTARPILSKFGGQLRTNKGEYTKITEIQKSKMAAGKMATVGWRPSWISSTPYSFWTARPILSKFGGLLLTRKCYYPQCSNFQKSKMVAGGWRPSWIFEIPIAFEPLDRTFRNLVANFGATRDITRTVHFFKSKMVAAGWQPSWFF
jgi:hypothetical protein